MKGSEVYSILGFRVPPPVGTKSSVETNSVEVSPPRGRGAKGVKGSKGGEGE